eukprot:GILI01018614.1.p1 GENE.GILI01018614.1~~GILI01018614.1.p1  ORF type:complete len:696 (-),score=59.19 GILI01018614.1:68-2101(-)
MRASRGIRQDVVERMEERVKSAKETKQRRADEIRAQKAKKDDAQLLAEDDDSFAESLEMAEDTVSGNYLYVDSKKRPVEGQLTRLHSDQPDGGGAGHTQGHDSPVRSRTPFQPKLTGKGRRAISKVTAPDFLVGWRHRQDQRVDHRKTETILKEIANCQDAPDITKRSRQLASKVNERNGLSGLSHIEAMVERDRLRKLAHWEKLHAQEQEDNLFHPKITVYAATLGATEGSSEVPNFNPASATVAQRALMPVSERLYADAFALEDRKVARERQRTQIATEERILSSQVRMNAETRKRPESSQPTIEDSLLVRHEHLKAASAAKANHLKAIEDRQRKPLINPVSDAIAARLPHGSKDRLLSGQKSIFEKLIHTEETNHTQPSKPMLTAEEKTRFLQKLESYEEKRKDKLRRLEEERESESLAECTFAPEIHSGYRKMVYDQNYNPPTGEEDELEMYTRLKEDRIRRNQHRETEEQMLTIGERTAQWQQRKETKLQQMRDSLANKQEEEVVQPPEAKRRSESVASDTVYYGGTPWGTTEHVERQLKSREMKAETLKRLTGRPKASAVTYNGPVPTAALPLRESSATRAMAMASLQPPVGPRDCLLSFNEAEAEYLTHHPSLEDIALQQRQYEASLAHRGPSSAYSANAPYSSSSVQHQLRDQYIAEHSNGALIPPSMW